MSNYTGTIPKDVSVVSFTKKGETTPYRSGVCDSKKIAALTSQMKSMNAYDHAQRKWVTIDGTVNTITHQNTPFKININKIRGYRADFCQSKAATHLMNVITSDNISIPIHNDVLYDMLTKTTLSNGACNDEFVYASLNKVMTVVRVGSEIYDALDDETARKKMPFIKTADLVPGAVYQTRSHKMSMFIGAAHTIEFKANYDAYYIVKDCQQLAKRKCLVWFPLRYRDINKTSPIVDFNNVLQRNQYDIRYALELTDKHSFVKELAKYDLPDKVFESLRKTATTCLKEKIEQIKIRTVSLPYRAPSTLTVEKYKLSQISDHRCMYSVIGNLFPQDEEIVIGDDFDFSTDIGMYEKLEKILKV